MTVTEPEAPVLAPPSARYGWAVVGMLWLICFFNYADRMAVTAIFPLLKKEFGFSKTELGLIGAAFTWVYAAAAPLAGQAGDRWPRKTVILGGLAIWSVITGFTALCSRLMQFVVVRGAEGLGETFYFPASMSLISDYHGHKTRSRAMSLHQTGVYAGTVGGSVLAGWMGQEYGWRSPFVLLAIAGVTLGVLLALFIREPRRNEAERALRGEPAAQGEPVAIPMGRFLAELVRTPTALLLAAAFFGANLVGQIFLTWMPTFLHEKFNLHLALAGFEATFFMQFASMIGATIGGTLADRWRQRRVGGRILVQAMGTFLGAPFIFLCGTTLNPTRLAVALTLFGLCKGLYDANIWASLYDVVPPSRRGAAAGLMNMIAWIGGGLGAFGIGVAADHHITMSVAIASTAVVYLAVALMLVVAATVSMPRDSRQHNEMGGI
jgi:MFS family permease